jgi:hypothetical protein
MRKKRRRLVEALERLTPPPAPKKSEGAQKAAEETSGLTFLRALIE